MSPPSERLLLRPGVRVLRRPSGHLQVGLRPGRGVVLPSDEPTRTLLERLAVGARVTPCAAVSRLADAGLLVAEGDLGQTGRPSAEGPVAIDTGRGTAAYAESLAGLLRSAGRRVLDGPGSAVAGDGARPPGATPGRPRRRSQGDDSEEPALTVLLTDGDLCRDRLDAPMRSGAAHLPAALIEGDWRLGPFTVPGLTACLRCVDAHETDRDPAWPRLVEQHASAETTPQLPVPAEAARTHVALGLVAADVCAFLDGSAPRTWSRVTWVDASLALTAERVVRHPACGCSWDQLHSGAGA